MAIKSIEDSKDLQAWGEMLGREGIAKAIIELCKEVATLEHHKNAVTVAGKIRALTEAAKYDCYWREFVQDGFEYQLKQARKVIPKRKKLSK